MSENENKKTELVKTKPFVRFIGKTLGLVTKEDMDVAIKAISGGISSEGRPELRSPSVIGQPIPPDMKADDFLKAYTGWVYSCVSVISLETANIDLTLYKRKSQNEFEIVENHPVLDLLYKVNPIYTSYLLWESTQAYLELVGEAFWWLSGKLNNPKEIWILRPDWVNVKDTKNKIISSYEYGPPGTKKEIIPAEQIIHFKDFNPRNSYRGYGPVKAGAKTIDEFNFQQDYSRGFFFNSALPGGALQTDSNLTNEQYDRIRDDWNSVHQGQSKAWKVAILEAGLKWQDVGLSQREMDFVEGRKMSRDDVMAIFRVPKPLLTFDDVNRAAAKEARAILLENVITHKMKRLVTFLNEFLLPRYGDESLFFNYKNPVPNDQAADLAYFKAALGNAPWMTVNEVREKENLEAVEGGDQLMGSFSQQPIGAITPEGKKAQKYRELTQFNLRIKPYGYMKSKMDEFGQKLVSTCEVLLKSMMKKKEPVQLSKSVIKEGEKIEDGEIVEENKEKDEAREKYWRTVVTRTDDRERKYKIILNEQFERQKDGVNKIIDDNFEKSIKIGKVKSDINDIEKFVTDDDVFTEPLMSFIKTVIEAEGITQIQSLVQDSVFYMQTPEIQKFLKKEGVKYVKAINEETASELRDTLSDGVKAKESIGQLKARISAVYEDAIGYRAERIARTEVLRATNFSTEQAYIQSKVVEAKEWLTAHDERTCPWCGPMDGKQIKLGESFFEKGDTVTGENDKGKKVRLQISVGNIDQPPLHPNCRCTLVPVLIDSEKSANSKDLLRKLSDATLKELKTMTSN